MTGYTHDLVENDQSFEEFVWSCARAFGALVSMRDDAEGAKIDLSPGESHYYQESLDRAVAELNEWNALTDDAKMERLQANHKRSLESAAEYRAEAVAANAKLVHMAAAVAAWVPPSEDHAKLKAFMLEQIEISRSPVRDESRPEPGHAEMEGFTDHLVHSVEYAAADLRKERERVAARREWLQKLDASVPLPAALRKEPNQ